MSAPTRPIGNANEIQMYTHCAICLREVPSDTSAAEYARLNVGLTPQGVQVWCVRHDANVMHIDFQGQKHPVNTTSKIKVAAPPPGEANLCARARVSLASR